MYETAGIRIPEASLEPPNETEQDECYMEEAFAKFWTEETSRIQDFIYEVIDTNYDWRGKKEDIILSCQKLKNRFDGDYLHK